MVKHTVQSPASKARAKAAGEGQAVEEAAEFAGRAISEQQADKDAVAWQELESEGKTIIEVDNAAFAEHFRDFAAANYPNFADWVERIAAMDPDKG